MTVPISTGTAFQRTLLAALWAGWCEVVERDALMCLWWCRSAAPEIVCDGGLIPDSLAERLERTKIAGLKVCFFDMTTDILIPSVVCIVIAPRYPYLVVTAASHHDPLRACTKALDENVMVRYVLDSHTRERRPPTLPPGNVRARIDHADWYARRQYHPEFKFLFERDRPRVAFAAFASQERWAVPEDMNALKQFARAREREGLTLLWSDITAPDATDLGRVVKVIVPECVPMSLDRNVRWLGTPRLLRRAAFATPHIAAFNPFPHPFP